MSKLSVPDFEDIQKFSKWVEQLEDKEIQSWKTQDWLRMYEKLDKIPQIRTAVEEDCLKDALIKLNRNYRLEEKDFRIMLEMGKKIGHNLAEQQLDFDLAGVNVKNSMLDGAREQFAEVADRTVYYSSNNPQAPTPLGDYKTAGSRFNIFDPELNPGLGGSARPINDYSSLISISSSTKTDIYGTAAVHESVHSQLQTLRSGQIEALEKFGISPVQVLENGKEVGFSKDFYRLLQYNDKYYVDRTMESTLYNDLSIQFDNGEITADKFDKEYKKMVFKGYRKQPLETQAQVIATTAEHYYRQETGQVSERTARAFTEAMGTPQIAKYNDKGGIDLLYHIENKEAADRLFNTYLSKDVLDKVSFNFNEASRMYTVSVPCDYALTESLKEVRIASQFVGNLGGVPPISINYNNPEKIVLNYPGGNIDDIKAVFTNNPYGQFSEDVIKNVEITPAENGGFTVSLPKNAKESEKILDEMSVIHRRVSEWQAASLKVQDALGKGEIPKIACSYVPDGADLSFLEKAELDVKIIGQNVKLPQHILMENVANGLDLSTAQTLQISGLSPKIGVDVKLPEVVEMNCVPEYADLSSAKRLVLDGKSAIEVGQGAKLPPDVTVKFAHGPMDLSSVERVVFDGVAPDVRCQLPQNVEVRNTFMSKLPDQPIQFSGECSLHGISVDSPINLDKCDLSKVEKLQLGNCQITANTKLPDGGNIVFYDAVEVSDKSALEKVLKGNLDDVSYIQVPSADLMKNMEYPKDKVFCFDDTKTLYVPNDEALNKLTSRYGELGSEVKVVRTPPSVVSTAGRQITAREMAHQAGRSALRLNQIYDDAFDKYVQRCAEFNWPEGLRKAGLKIETGMSNVANRVANNRVTQFTAEYMQRWGEEFIKTPTGKKIAEQVEKSMIKTYGKAVAKSAAKKIPLVCVGVAASMAAERFERGEYIKGGLEVVSGVAACVPVAGTAVSLAIDAGVFLSDLFFSMGHCTGSGPSEEYRQQRIYTTESTRVVNPHVEMYERLNQPEQQENPREHRQGEIFSDRELELMKRWETMRNRGR